MGFFGMQKVEQPQAEVPALPKEEPASAPAPSRAGSTVIAQGITFTGTLIRGPVAADVVRVAGRVEGNVSAREHMRLESSGSLDGDVKTASLVVEDGGILNGRCTTVKPQTALEPELSAVRSSQSLEFGPGFELDEEQ